MGDVTRRGVLGLFGGVGGAVVLGGEVTAAAPAGVEVAVAVPKVVKPFNWARMELLRRGLIGEVGADVYVNWFPSLEVECLEGGVLTASVPTPFMKRWIEQHHMSALLRAAQRADASVEQVIIVVRKLGRLVRENI